MILIGNRDDVVLTTSGHSIGFKTGQETYIHNDPSIIKQCIARGHTIKKDVDVEGTTAVVDVEGTTAVIEPKVNSRAAHRAAHRKAGYIVTA